MLCAPCDIVINCGITWGLVYKGVFVTLRNTTSFCKESWFEYKVVIEVLLLERLLGFDCFGVESV
jgi:hypothetical protein